MTSFPEPNLSIALMFSDKLSFDRAAFAASVCSALEQDCGDGGPLEVLLIDDRGPQAPLDFLPADLPNAERIRHLPGRYANRAAAYNAAIDAARGRYLLNLYNAEAQVVLRRSAARTLLMSAVRHPDAGMIYADYERIDAGGGRKEVHLLDWHEGRLRDTVDFGAAILYPTGLLRDIGRFDEHYQAADLYDLRLRLSERHPPVHIANRYAGSLYTVASPSKAHNVFDYLLSGKSVQIEMEAACTEHLKRIGAYLAPGAQSEPRAGRSRLGRVPSPRSSASEGRSTPEERRGKPDGSPDILASVVIPVNHRPEFIGRAIESVQRQTVRQVEVIVVVNGGPSDPTAEVVRRYMPGGDRHDAAAPEVRLIVVDINNLGLCLNSGIAAARGRYYVQLDSDDRLKPDAVEKILAVYDSDQKIGMVVGSYEVWDLDPRTGELSRNASIPVVTHDEWTADNGRNNLLRINGAGAPRSAQVDVIREAGWFGVNDDPSCRNYGEDYDLVLRISERWTIGRVWEPIYEVIRHAGGTDHSIDQATIERNDNAKDNMRRAALQRRRALNETTEAPRHREYQGGC